MRWALAVLLAAIGAYFAAVFIWLGTDRRLEKRIFDTASIYNTAPEGLSLAHRYLESQGRPVAALQRRIDAGELESRAVVLRIEPGYQPRWEAWLEEIGDEIDEAGEDENGEDENGEDENGEDENGEEEAEEDESEETEPQRFGTADRRLLVEREEAWVRAGGRLVLALAEAYGALDALDTEEPSEKAVISKVFPLWPGVRELAPPAARAIGGPGLERLHALWLIDDWPLVARRQLGRGEVVVLAVPEIFHNQHLGEADHLAFLEALAPPGRPVYFDESVHGAVEPPGLWEFLGRYHLQSAVLLALVAGAAMIWRGSRRLGPADEAYGERRSEAVDLVDSLARLYERALRRSEAIELYRRALAEATMHRTGLRGSALEARLHKLGGTLASHPDETGKEIKPAEFRRALERLNEAFRRLEDDEHSRNQRGLR